MVLLWHVFDPWLRNFHMPRVQPKDKNKNKKPPTSLLDVYLELILFLKNYGPFTMLCQFLLYSKMTQSCIYIHSLSYIIFQHGLSQETGYSSLCYTIGPHCLSILFFFFFLLFLRTTPVAYGRSQARS